MGLSEWKKYILSSTAGVLTVTQFILCVFFFKFLGLMIIRIVGVILWILSVIFGWVPIYTLRKHGRVPEGKSYIHTTTLVDNGIYGIVRHPQFLAGILINLALILIAQHWVILILGIVSAVIFYIDTRNADKGCIEKFGEEYERYSQSVPQLNFIVGIIQMLRSRR